MNTKRILVLGIVLFSLTSGCPKNKITVIHPAGGTSTRTSCPPDIIFVLADDMGYEMPAFNGGSSKMRRVILKLDGNKWQNSSCCHKKAISIKMRAKNIYF